MTDMVADVKGEKVADILAYLVADREVNKVTDISCYNLVRELVGRRQCFSQLPYLRARIRKLCSCSFICFNHIITNQQFDGNTFTYF